MSIKNRKKKSATQKELTIGLLWPHLGFDYSVFVYNGITRVAREKGVNTICFAGGSIKSPYNNEATGNFLYNIAGPENIDGLIIAAAILGAYIKTDELYAFCRSFLPMPVISIGVEIEGITSLKVDNYKGMYDVVSHLIEHHKHKRIVFVKGPDTNPEANTRYQAYADALKNHGILLDPALIFKGDFRQESGADAVCCLLDRLKISLKTIDAIVCANDAMAVYAMEEIQRRGYSVPGDVAVAGFDNIGECICLSPPLTSVNQPFGQIGRQAALLLLDKIEGKKVPEKNNLPTESVIRQSCGCKGSTSQKMLAELCSHHKNRGFTSVADKNFWTDFNSLLSQTVNNGVNVEMWEDLITSIRLEHISGNYAGEGEIEKREEKEAGGNKEDNWQMIRGIVAAFMLKKLKFDKKNQIVSDISAYLLTAIDMEHLLEYLAEYLPQLDIRNFYLSLFMGDPRELSGNKRCPDQAKLILAYNSDGIIKIDEKKRIFSTSLLAPRGLIPENTSRTIIIKPLYSRDKPLGFMLLETDSTAGAIFETLKLQISNSLQGIMMVDHIRLLNEWLTDENIHIKTEMKLARRIQTALLPRNIKEIHSDLSISALMLPAEEVGGDYYDVSLDKNHNLWLGIGDVSGHGVTPGLIMMIAQTVHTSITTNYDTSPRHIVNMVNKVLYKNVHGRLHTEHFMSFNTLKYRGKGRFQFSGLHMDLIIYRQKEHRCIQIPTRGTYLNFLDDIEDQLFDDECVLEKEDILILYTDGITEARNGKKEFLDIPGLEKLIIKYAHMNIDIMGEYIIKDVLAWCDNVQKDDMSLVLVKRVH